MLRILQVLGGLSAAPTFLLAVMIGLSGGGMYQNVSNTMFTLVWVILGAVIASAIAERTHVIWLAYGFAIVALAVAVGAVVYLQLETQFFFS